ncbi:AAA family ATPase [Chondromyces apiculatus]|uniref:MoxR-like ATPase n=1 Tax=Chondromyces apiculatus DSM 436 TaxID=1192034 RepID=A0A017T8J2_9BACT|nr:AAA family ATPase [Chondromyces apiculatus]EYF05125.1 MoxR-like ATPase [Chondromyces apiculatus DSM 436]
MSPSSLAIEGRAAAIPIGPRLLAVLEVAYRARRPVLLEGPTGIGKSELVRGLAEQLGIGSVVLDLSLLEPPDLVGLPVIHEGRTVYAPPDALPQGGAGILMLEELNRAERYIQQPALQLLSARRLHQYELPPGWVCFAAVNPESADYQVTPLDRALRARFLGLHVRADRATWLAWAEVNGVHPGVVSLVRAHERAFDDVPPRTWTYAAQVLSVLKPEEIASATVMRDALSGYLPPSWVEVLIAAKDGWSSRLSFDVRGLLAEYGPGSPAARELVRARERGETDRFDEVVARLCPLLAGPEVPILASQGKLSLSAFEALCADLPGDHRERLEEALGGNATATALIDLKPDDLLQNYPGSAAERRILQWRADPVRRYRVGLAVTALRAHLELQARLTDVRRSNAARIALGQLLSQLPEVWALRLVETLKKVGITPIRPQ